MLGIGGGGDVVGALATSEACRLYHGADPAIGGVAWERRVVDPSPGPHALEEIEGGRPLAGTVLAAGPQTRVRGSGVVFAESRMAELLGAETVLIDILSGPAAVADGLAGAVGELGADLVVMIDVGGDAIANGEEQGLASPLCDAVMLAAGAILQERGVPVLGGIFGPGCDGELKLEEVLVRLAELAAAGGLAGARALTPPVAAALERAVEAIPTEASAQPLRCFRGELGQTTIRAGARSLELTPVGALTFYFDVAIAVRSVARLAGAVRGADSLEHANDLLHAAGIRTELDFERSKIDR